MTTHHIVFDGAPGMPLFRTWVIIILVVGAGSVALIAHKGPFPAAADTAQNPAPGREIYDAHCAVCHGENGDGNGKEAHRFLSEPTDFTQGIYKFKTTYPGSPPLMSDLYQSVTEGFRGTGMLGQLHLTDEERRAVVEYMVSLSDRFGDGPVPRSEIIEIPTPPEVTREMIAAGRQVYVDAGCDKCHGTGGEGDGPSARDLVDYREHPVQMPDLTKLPRKMGNDPRDLYRLMITGVEGTPMPSYRGALDESQIWAIVAYLESVATGTLENCMGMMGRMMDMVGEECVGMQIDMPAARARMMGRMGPGMMRR